MSEGPADSLWLHHYRMCSLTEVVELSGLTESELREWVEAGILDPADPQVEPWSFRADCVVTLRTACRLRQDFDLDTHSVALMVTLLDRVHALEAEVRELRAQLPQTHR
ncbi:chaperone modulator CbpM [Methylotetracoccus oryzae]|uniref:chaperone modulator CbpM n=1 Tax=Methylotetracoccus oryzae TaxID=1919059 RepID=UPI0011187A18|nr:chaperone modulator CbpM [Methylotetracoccus oryzae]